MTATLDGVLPATQAAFDGLAQYLSSRGIRVAVADYGGFRTQADTTKILGYRQADYDADLKAGRIPSSMTLQQYRPIAPYGQSFHDYGAAFDLSVVGSPAGMSATQALAVAGDAAPDYGLRWGGQFSNPDPAHFELDESLNEAAQDWANYTASGSDSGTAGPPGGVVDPSTLLTLAGIVSLGAIAFALWRRFHA